jgi:hypothetical protein
MAENPIRKEDIIDGESIERSLENVAKILTTIITLMQSIKAEGKGLSESLAAVNPADKDGQQVITNTIERTKELKKEKTALVAAEKQLLDLRAKLEQTSTEQFRKEQELKKAIQDRTKAVKDSIKSEGAEEGSLIKLKQKLSELRQEYDKAGKAARDKLSPEIRKVTDEITKAEKAVGVHSRGVGNYKNSIMSAGKELLGFLGVAGGGVVILAKLKDAFLDTEAGVDVFKRGQTAIKAFFNSIVTGNIQMAGTNAAAAFEISKQYSEIRKGDRQDLIDIARMEVEIQKLRLDASKAGLSEVETLRLINIASEKEDELIKFRIKDKQDELDVIKQLIPFMLDNTALLDRQSQLQAEIVSLEGDKSLRIAREKASLEERITAAKAKQLQSVKAEVSRSYIGDVEVAKDVSIELKEIDEARLIDRADYWERQGQLAKGEAEKELEIERQKEREKQELITTTFQIASSLQTILANNIEKQRQTELRQAGDNAAEIDRINKEYGKKEQNLAITMAVINGALAITQAWAQEKSWQMALARSIAAAAVTVAEISTISSQQFAEGGEIKGKSHRDGGVHVEAEGGEFVINKRSTSKYKELISAINKDNPMQIAEEIRNRKFHTVWGGVHADLSTMQHQDPYTRMMYELMRSDVKVYTDSNGDTVLRRADGSKQIIRKYR